MKVVLFCGGMGMRLREFSEAIPKPMVNIGYRPILWHVMKYYAHYGHKDFILCLGWKADYIKQYFLNYDECLSNDFVMRSGKSVSLLHSDIHDWNITFVDTGAQACVGERLAAVRPFLEGEELFLANYTDGLSDVPLPSMIDYARENGFVASFLGVRPSHTFHLVGAEPDGKVRELNTLADAGMLINGGYFVLRQEIFDYMQPGEELVAQPFHRLMDEDALGVYRYNGFWACMDTFKEKQLLDDQCASGNAAWKVWKQTTDEQRFAAVQRMVGGRMVDEPAFVRAPR